MTTIPQILFQQAARRPDALAIMDGDWDLTYGDLAREVETAAEIMNAMGLAHGDKFGIWACLLYTSPSPRDLSTSRMPSSA